MKHNKNCPVCESFDRLIFFKWGDYDIIHCDNCGLDYCYEMIEKEKGGNSSPVHKEGVEMMANSYHLTTSLAKNYVKERKVWYENILGRNCQKILEVGCGPGVFYKPWSELNIKWEGIDINTYWKEFGKKNKIPISSQSIENIDNQYDVIMAYQVIEHVEAPLEFMKNIIKILKPGGIVHLELPNQDSLTSQLRQLSPKISYDYGFIQPPMHLRAYRKQTIGHLFNKFNIDTKMITTCGNTDKIWGQARNYNLSQKFFYTMMGKIKKGSLLIGLGQKDVSN